ncbi:hypothetical protein [Flavobacterium sp. 245]|uniref:hypothetical protein n=1 Tax=Flavobacterium sp. 245 TaxID=2512115 RepID=UPI00105CB2C4|nr:hypothetical protein [Flavobacterium sp. 245]TDO99207.1 hypothetical protein EV145_107114 [Flavobacterium sp. 245]
MSAKRNCFLYFSKAILVIGMLSCLRSYAQIKTDGSDQLAENLQKAAQNIVPDVVYIQTSKNIYETEEDVWFKGYVLDGQYFTPSMRSKILFVQLIEDKTENVVWEKKYEIENGFVDGHLFLENSLPEGNYTLAGYSAYSFLKEPKEFYALKKITIVKAISQRKNVGSSEKDNVLHFSTFPEGGKLISGIQSRLGFKAVNLKGLPVAVSGTLFEDNVPLLKFKSGHAGMGAISLTPLRNKKYHIQLNEPELATTFTIDTIHAIGKALSLIKNTNEALVFKVSQSDVLQEEKVYLRLQVRGIVYSIAVGMLKKELMIKIPLKEIPKGIAEVTLFNKDLLPIAERLVYVNLEQKLTIKPELDKIDYTKRERVNLKIKVTDQNDQAVIAHLGVSIYDGLYQNKQDAKNIQSHFLLSTQLKGNIYNPAYYFDEENKDRKETLDVLMLTQGWRNYVWNEENLRDFSNTMTPILFDEVKGKVQLEKPDNKQSTTATPKGVVVFAADDAKGKDLITTDEEGSFTITPDHLKKGENGYTYLKLMALPEPKYLMNVKKVTFEQINKNRKNKTVIYPFPEIEKVHTDESSPFSEREKVNKLNEVLIVAKKKMFRDKYIGKLDSLAKLNNDYVCSLNVLNCPNWVKHGGEITKPVEGKQYKIFTGSVTTNTIYHYRDYTEDELLKMFNLASVEGYYGKKVFYEAVYDDVTITDSTPDYRNTLFWKSDLVTNQEGEANITFFCSDIKSLFTGTIEGVTGDGLLGTQNFNLLVKK